MALQQAELHLALQNPQAAWSLLSTYLENADLTATWRAEAARVAAGVLTTHLLQPQQADSLLERSMSIITTNDPIAYATLGISRATLLCGSMRDPVSAEAVFRRVMSLDQACPAASYLAAADGLAALLMASGRSAEVPTVLLQTAAHHEAFPSGLARKLADCGAPTNILQDAVRLLRRRVGKAAMDEQVSSIERLQPELVEMLLVLGRPEDAVGECRVLAFCASDRGYPLAVELAARCFKILDGHLGRANRLLDFHQDTEAAGGPTNPLLDLAPLQDPVRDEFENSLPRHAAPLDWMGCRRRAFLLSWMDRPAEALNAARSAFAVCPLTAKELQSCADAITRPVLVATRDAALAQRLTDYMLRGTAGADGIVGSSDDLDDPFAEAYRRLSYGKH
jgi:hypothetical protein